MVPGSVTIGTKWDTFSKFFFQSLVVISYHIGDCTFFCGWIDVMEVTKPGSLIKGHLTVCTEKISFVNIEGSYVISLML